MTFPGGRGADALVNMQAQVDSGSLDRVAGQFGTILNPATLATAAIAGAGTALVSLGSSWNDVERIIRVGTGATGTALEGLREDVRGIADDVPDSLGTIASVVADLNTHLGLTGEPLQELGTQVLDLARITNTSTESIVEGTRAFSNFGIEGRGAVVVMDQLLLVSQQTGAPIESLLTDLAAYGPVLANANFSLTETVAFFGSLNEAGIATSRVMPGVNALFRRLADEGVEDLGAALADTIDEIVRATSDTEALNLATLAFGAEGAQRMTTAIRSGALTAADLNDELAGLANNAANAAPQVEELATETETLGEAWQSMLNDLSSSEEIILAAGTAFDVVAFSIDLASQSVTGWIRAFGEARDLAETVAQRTPGLFGFDVDLGGGPAGLSPERVDALGLAFGNEALRVGGQSGFFTRPNLAPGPIGPEDPYAAARAAYIEGGGTPGVLPPSPYFGSFEDSARLFPTLAFDQGFRDASGLFSSGEGDLGGGRGGRGGRGDRTLADAIAELSEQINVSGSVLGLLGDAAPEEFQAAHDELEAQLQDYLSLPSETSAQIADLYVETQAQSRADREAALEQARADLAADVEALNEELATEQEELAAEREEATAAARSYLTAITEAVDAYGDEIEGYAAALPFLGEEAAAEVQQAIDDLEFERGRLTFYLTQGLDLETAQLATAVEVQARANDRRAAAAAQRDATRRDEQLLVRFLQQGYSVEGARRLLAGESVGADGLRPEVQAQREAAREQAEAERLYQEQQRYQEEQEQRERERERSRVAFDRRYLGTLAPGEEVTTRAEFNERYGGRGASSARYYAGRELSDIPPVTQNFDFRDSIIGIDNVELFMRNAVEEVLREWGVTPGGSA